MTLELSDVISAHVSVRFISNRDVNEKRNSLLHRRNIDGYSRQSLHIFQRGKIVPLPKTIEAIFNFAQFKKQSYLILVEKKRVANFMANKLSETIFEKVGGIIEARIAPETLKGFHTKNPEGTKITVFDNVDIPNVDKLSLYEPDLVGTTLFDEYAKHGDLWYIVARAREYGYVAGVTRDASVTVFDLTDKNKYLEYVTKEIIPLILETIS